MRMRMTPHPRSPRAKQWRYLCIRHQSMVLMHFLNYSELVESAELAPAYVCNHRLLAHLHSLQKKLVWGR